MNANQDVGVPNDLRRSVVTQTDRDRALARTLSCSAKDMPVKSITCKSSSERGRSPVTCRRTRYVIMLPSSNTLTTSASLAMTRPTFFYTPATVKRTTHHRDSGVLQ